MGLYLGHIPWVLCSVNPFLYNSMCWYLLELHPTPASQHLPQGLTWRSCPRLSFTLETTQSEWSFTKARWSAYISQSVVLEEVKVQQLQAACDKDLLRRVYDAGGLVTLNTEVKLMAQIQKLQNIFWAWSWQLSMGGSDWYKSVARPQVPDQQKDGEVECFTARSEIADIDPTNE